MKSVFFVFISLIFAISGFTQSANKMYLPIKQMPMAFQKQIKTVNSEFKFAYGMRLDSCMSQIRNYTADSIHYFIFKEKDYEKVFRCPFWLAMDSARYCAFLPELIRALSDTTFIGLTNANDITIWCRVNRNELTHSTYNYQIDDDIFRVCGRVHWILKRLTKNEFGSIRCDAKMDDIKMIQKQWWKWLDSLYLK